MRVRFAPIFLVIALPAAATAQPVLDIRDDLAFDRTESWAMQYVTSVSLFTGLGVPRSSEPGALELGFEASWVPSLSDQEATVGFNGTKKEEINRTSIFGRLRLRLGLPHKLGLDLSYLPPLVELDGIEPHLFAVAVERPVFEGERARVGLRLVGQGGTLEGDITCSASEVAAGDDVSRNPFLCEAPSDDELITRSGSLELSSALRVADGRWEPYLSAGVHYMDLEFRVRARYSGIIDRTREFTDGWTWSVAAGVHRRLSERLWLTTELFYTPLEVVRPPSRSSQVDPLFHVRGMVGYRVR